MSDTYNRRVTRTHYSNRRQSNENQAQRKTTVEDREGSQRTP
jgi:hypothetical protein